MAIPVISKITNYLGPTQGEAFVYQPFATENPIKWQSSPLPAGLSLDSPTEYAATGVASTDVITATGHTFANRDAVLFLDLTGGSGLTANTIYYVRDSATNTFKLATAPGGSVINFSSDISAATISKVPTGKISGTVTQAGVTVVGLVAINGTGPSEALVFPIGVKPGRVSSTTSTELTVDLTTTLVTSSDASSQGHAWLFAAKSGDGEVLAIRFVRGNVVQDLGTLTNLQLAIKQRDTEQVLILGGGANGGSPPDVVQLKVGSGVDTSYLIYVHWDRDALVNALSDNETDDGTTFEALAELTWTGPNSTGVGPAAIPRTSRTFRVLITRELQP